MKKFILFILLHPAFPATGQELNVMTFNIRYNTSADSSNAWPFRKTFVASQIMFYQSHVVGLQEVFWDQLNDLERLLPGYRYVGVGRDDGKNAGEFSPIFFDTLSVELLESSTFWLSETPAIAGSKSWDAALPRIATWGLFKNKKTGKTFLFINTHFDHIGQTARSRSAGLLRRFVDSKGSITAIVTGDFNATIEEEPYRIMIDSSKGRQRLLDTNWLTEIPHFGPVGTYNGWKTDPAKHREIDFIFCSRRVRVIRHATLATVWGNRFASDHFAVWSAISF